MSEQVWWYATRAAGLMTWSTATASVIVGLLLSIRAVRARTGPWFLDLHRYLSGISVLFLVAHVGALSLDSHIEFSPRELFVPGESSWEPEAVAWGIIAAYVLIAVELTSLLRSRIRTSIWRPVHLLSFVTVGAGTYHAWLAGSDVHSPIAWTVAGFGSVLVVIFIAVRLRRRAHEDPDAETRFPDQLALLEEMRQRLEDLPIPESTPQPQLTALGAPTLPRRAPVGSTPPRDPLSPAVGNWVDPSASDPFAARPLDPFRHTTASPIPPAGQEGGPGGRFRSRPFTDAEIDAEGRDLFDTVPTPSTPMPPSVPDPGAFDQATPPWPTSAPAVPHTDLFAHPEPDDATAEFLSNPFEPVAPPIASITEPEVAPEVEVEVQPDPGPPPLPTDAIDPETGEPDEAAYREWLKDWLAYAEQYGDAAPEDPSRV